MRKARILYLATVDWFFVSHRLPLAIAARDAGWDVTVVALDTGEAEKIRELGLTFISLPFSRSGINPLREAATLLRVFRVIQRVRPDILHNISLKPVLYGGIAAALAGVAQVVSAVTGFGHLFSANVAGAGVVRRVVESVLRVLWHRKGSVVIVQNPDHARELVERNLAPAEAVVMIEGAGVDMQKFSPRDVREVPRTILLPARMLRGKGVIEFSEVARRMKENGSKWRFVLVGPADDDNPEALSTSELLELSREKGVEWWGRRDDMEHVLSRATLVVLPSTYGEGMPKALIEALACGRPIVTTDIPGCRQLVVRGCNGWLVPPGDIDALHRTIEEAMNDLPRLEVYGRCSRKLAIERFALESVIQKTLASYFPLSPHL